MDKETFFDNNNIERSTNLLTMEEITRGLDEIMGGKPYKAIKEKSDDKGLFSVEFETTEGEKEHYSYFRKGNFGKYGGTDETILTRLYMLDDQVDGGEVIAYFRNGKWEYVDKYSYANKND